MCSKITKHDHAATILVCIYMPKDKCHNFSEDSYKVFDNNNSHSDKKSTTTKKKKKTFWMTIIKLYNQINAHPFEDVQTEVERLMKEAAHMFPSPRRH